MWCRILILLWVWCIYGSTITIGQYLWLEFSISIVLFCFLNKHTLWMKKLCICQIFRHRPYKNLQIREHNFVLTVNLMTLRLSSVTNSNKCLLYSMWYWALFTCCRIRICLNLLQNWKHRYCDDGPSIKRDSIIAYQFNVMHRSRFKGKPMHNLTIRFWSIQRRAPLVLWRQIKEDKSLWENPFLLLQQIPCRETGYLEEVNLCYLCKIGVRWKIFNKVLILILQFVRAALI